MYMEVSGRKAQMNKRILLFLIPFLILGITVPVYGVENAMNGQGVIAAPEEQVIHMNQDQELLENQISELNDSIQEEGTVENSKLRSRIQSKGKIKFENSKVFFTSDDLLYLADEIDKLENNYKISLIDALNLIGTYFKKDGTIIYSSEENEVDTEKLKTAVSLGSIRQGIISSQSVDFIKNLQAVDKDENLLFYQSEEAKNNKDDLNFTTTDTGFPLYYKEADANNLSAGSTAWVNGILLKGTGEDNKISWQNGYNEGYSKGVADALNKVNIEYSYHKHTAQNGSCYGPVQGVRPIRCECNSYAFTDSLPGYEGIASCANCKHNHPGEQCTGTNGYESYTYTGLVCGKTEKTIESATIVY